MRATNSKVNLVLGSSRSDSVWVLVPRSFLTMKSRHVPCCPEYTCIDLAMQLDSDVHCVECWDTYVQSATFPVTRNGKMEDRLLDIEELAKHLKIPTKTIRNKLCDGSWPMQPLRIGRALRWRESDVVRAIANLAASAESGARRPHQARRGRR